MAKAKKFSVAKTIFLSILAIIVGFVLGFGVYFYLTFPKDKGDIYVSGDLQIHFLELGNHYTGDCVYINAGGTDILIDAGSKNTSTVAINSYLENYVLDGKIEYVIATHAHEDHLAGFYSESSRTGVFDKYEVGTIIDFPLTNKENPGANTVLGKYISARDNEIANGAVHYTALECYNNQNGATRTFELAEGIELEILYSYYYDHTQSAGENDYSVCCMINQGDKHFLFTGDLEEKGEKKLVEHYNNLGTPLPHCEVYKAGHHGSKTSSCPELMEAITPSIVCVCCCAGTSEYTDDNANQFPTQEFIDNVAPYTDKIYVTSMVDNYVDKSSWTNQGTVKSMNGNIVVTSNKHGTTVECSNNDTLLKDTDWFRDKRQLPSYWAS